MKDSRATTATTRHNRSQESKAATHRLLKSSLPVIRRAQWHPTFLRTVRGLTLLTEILCAAGGMVVSLAFPQDKWEAKIVVLVAFPLTFVISGVIFLYRLCNFLKAYRVMCPNEIYLVSSSAVSGRRFYAFFLSQEIAYAVIFLILYVVVMGMAIADFGFGAVRNKL